VVAAKVFGTTSGGPGLKLTLGCRGDDWPYNGTIDVAKGFGNTLVDCDVDSVCHDEKNRVVTCPAYMKNAKPVEVFDNMGKMIETLVKGLSKDQKKKPSGGCTDKCTTI